MKTTRILLAAALSLMALTSCGPSDAQLKEEYNKGCMGNISAVGNDPAMRAAYTEFCDCSGDKVIKGLSRAELKQMGKGQSQAEIAAKVTPLIQTCTDELTRKMQAAAQ